MRVAVCDYGAGNVRSVLSALDRIGAPAELTADPERGRRRRPRDPARRRLGRKRDGGAAAHGRRRRRFVERRGPTLGICLGLQLALEWSEEDGGVAGLGLLPGRAVRLTDGRVPRIGWAPVEPGGEALLVRPLVRGRDAGGDARSEGVVAEARSGAFVGCQFHPEKSGPAGLRYLERCLSLA